MRYTEARLTKIAEEMINDIEQDTVDRRWNFDGSLQEPVMLPTKFPNHLCNGTMGIAVGMATNMAPHNLNEVIDACLLLIEKEWKEVEVPIDFMDNNENLSQDEWNLQTSDENITENTYNEETPSIDSTTNLDPTNSNETKKIKYSVSIDEIMEIVKWPDFPTGWCIFDSNRIKEVYSKGRGGIVCRGKHEIEEIKSWKNIVITEIPYMVNKSTLVSKIGELVVDKKIDWIVDIRDESNRDRIRVVLQLRKWIDPDQILIQLYKATDLQSNFNVNNVSLVDNGLQPRTLNIKELLMEFVTFRRQVVYRRSNYQLDKAKDRLHILEWLKAIDIIDEVIETIKNLLQNKKQKTTWWQNSNFQNNKQNIFYLWDYNL